MQPRKEACNEENCISAFETSEDHSVRTRKTDGEFPTAIPLLVVTRGKAHYLPRGFFKNRRFQDSDTREVVRLRFEENLDAA
jgi:hypothetical protein